MTALPFAWRSLVRQPARAALGILGVAAVGALLLDMLLLSDGLVTSMRDMLERTGFDIRVTATGDLPRGGSRIQKSMPPSPSPDHPSLNRWGRSQQTTSSRQPGPASRGARRPRPRRYP